MPVVSLAIPPAILALVAALPDDEARAQLNGIQRFLELALNRGDTCKPK